MKHRSDLLNFLAKKYELKSYLEVGVYRRNHNFNKVKMDNKLCVDPDPEAKADHVCTSDFYFETINGAGSGEGGRKKFDLIFLDGLHHADQIKRDIQHAFEILNPGGFIVIHDCNPPTEDTTCVPRGSQEEWCGDVYKTICQISSPMFTLDFDYGCCVIKKDDGLSWSDKQVSWEEFDRDRAGLINLIPVRDWLNKYA